MLRSNLRISFVAFAALLALVAVGAGLLLVAPVAILIALLALGWFPGEETIVARRMRAARTAHRPVITSASTARPPHALTPLGPALLAFNLAVRPPPRPAC